MTIDLNNPEDFTVENVKKLIASENDSVDTQFRVTNDGFLYLSRIVGGKGLEEVLFRLETNHANNGYVGTEASENEGWVNRIYKVVKKNWPRPDSPYIDTF